jgi:ABC-2 type transport system permease protein
MNTPKAGTSTSESRSAIIASRRGGDRTPAVRARSKAGYPVTLRRTVRSELIKFRTLRPNLWLLAVATGFVVLLGPIQTLGSVVAGSERAITNSADAVSTALTGSATATLLLGILGVLLVGGEYAPRAIRTTFMMVPRRGVVVTSKALALTLLIAVTGVVAVVTAVTGSMLVLARGDMQVTWTSPHVLRVSAAMVWYLVGWGVFGLAAGWVTRSKLGGAALLMTVMLVLAPVLGLIPGRLGEVVVALMPSSAGAAMVSTHPASANIAGVSVNLPAYGFVLWTLYLVGFTAVTAVVVSRRDA